jgi:hypothetical protein
MGGLFAAGARRASGFVRHDHELLRPDVFDLVQQVQTATDNARRVTDQPCGRAPSSTPDPEATVAARQHAAGRVGWT